MCFFPLLVDFLLFLLAGFRLGLHVDFAAEEDAEGGEGGVGAAYERHLKADWSLGRIRRLTKPAE